MNDPKYLVMYEGVVTGSLAGRDDGFPETKTVVCNSLADAGRYADAKDVRLFLLTPANMADAVRAKGKAEKTAAAQKARETENNERAELARLQAKYPDARSK